MFQKRRFQLSPTVTSFIQNLTSFAQDLPLSSHCTLMTLFCFCKHGWVGAGRAFNFFFLDCFTVLG